MTLARGVAEMANRRIPGDRGSGGRDMFPWQMVLLARLTGLRHLLWLMAVLCLSYSPASAATLSFTVNTSEPVVVTGTPRIAIDVGGVTRYASYASGSGSSALTFGYAVQAADFDANGITLVSPVDLNGGSIADVAGNPASVLTFTLPATSSLKVQTYTTSFTTSPITNANANAISFAIAKAPTGAAFTYSISSSGGAGTVAGSGTISGATHTVSNVDVSALPSGTLTLSVTVSTAAGGTGAAKTATSTPSFTGVLDSLPASAASFSVRRLRSAYSGPLLRVRRSTDSAAQDIGVTVAGNLDTAALTSFCGSASCFVTTWYDQSGNGRSAVQATNTAQPALVTSGVIERLNSRPGTRFATGWVMAAPNSLTNSNEFTVSMTMVERTRSNPITFRLLASNLNTNRVFAHIPHNNNGGTLYFDVGSYASPYRISQVWTLPVGAPAIVSLRNSASAVTRSVYVNGSFLVSGNGYAAASDIFGFGENYQGQISEVILFPSSIADGDRQTLERSQGDYYGITVP